MSDLFQDPQTAPAFPLPNVDPSWLPFFTREYAKRYMADLRSFVGAERKSGTVYPPAADVFTAFRLTGLDALKVMVLGQDPYHGAKQAHGLSFSVKPGVKPPPSLVNIFKELHADLGVQMPTHGHLEKWATQGVMMLNAVLTVRAGAANSHAGKGWEAFTDAAIDEASAKIEPVIFVLWGKYAQAKGQRIDETRHLVLKAAHPSPYSADAGFFGSKPFSRINGILKERGEGEIDWSLDSV